MIGVGGWFYWNSRNSPAVTNSTEEHGGDHFEWGQFSSESLHKQLVNFSSQEQTAKTGRTALESLWAQVLADDQQVTKLTPETQQLLVDTFQANQELLRNEDGSYIHGGPEVYGQRLEAIRDRLLNHAFSSSSSEAFHLAANASFEELQRSWNAVELPTNPAERQLLLLKRAYQTTEWLQKGDWKNLSIADRGALLTTLSNSGINRDFMSVRWTGLLVPPMTGEYRLGPLLNNLANGHTRIVINGEVVFDTERAPLSQTPNEPVLLGDAVLLSTETPAQLLVEYRYDINATTVDVPFQLLNSYKYPMMVLMWHSPSTGLQMVPPSAYRLPRSATASSREGLWVQYFDKTDFGVPWAQGPTAGIQEVWIKAPFPPKSAELAQAVIEDSLHQLFADSGKATPSVELLALLNAGAPIFPFLNAPDRQRVLDRVLALAPGFIDLPAGQLHAFMAQMAMLPGEARLKLLTAWAQHHVSGSIKEIHPAGARIFNSINHNPYGFLSVSLTGRHRPELDLLLEESLVKPDGRPELELIAITAYALYLQNRGPEFRNWVLEKQSGLSGDELAEWLMARAWMEEAFILEGCKEVHGIPYFEQAAEAAKSPHIRMDAIRELIVRETTVGQVKLALQRLDDALSEFKDPAHQEVLNSLKLNIESMRPVIAQQAVQIAEMKSQAARAAQRNVLQSRLERARLRGDNSSAARYQGRLEP